MLHEDPSPSIQGRACHQEPAPASPSPTQPLLQGNEDLSLPRHLRRFLTLKSVRLIAFTLLMVVFAVRLPHEPRRDLMSLQVISAVWRKKLMTAYGVRYVFFRQELTNLLYNIWASLIVIYKAREGLMASEPSHLSSSSLRTISPRRCVHSRSGSLQLCAIAVSLWFSFP